MDTGTCQWQIFVEGGGVGFSAEFVAFVFVGNIYLHKQTPVALMYGFITICCLSI